MMVLCVLSGPADQKEFSIDSVSTFGRCDTLIVRRTDAGFMLLAPSRKPDTKPAEIGSVLPVAGKTASFTLKFDKKEQTFDFLSVIPSFSAEALQKEKTLDLQASDGEIIHVRRSGGVTYLIQEKPKGIFTSH